MVRHGRSCAGHITSGMPLSHEGKTHRMARIVVMRDRNGVLPRADQNAVIISE